jgi:hypothetical protein
MLPQSDTVFINPKTEYREMVRAQGIKIKRTQTHSTNLVQRERERERETTDSEKRRQNKKGKREAKLLKIKEYISLCVS